MTAYNKWSK